MGRPSFSNESGATGSHDTSSAQVFAVASDYNTIYVMSGGVEFTFYYDIVAVMEGASSWRVILSDTSDATAPVTVSGSSRCMSPNVDEHVYALVSDSIKEVDDV